MAPSQLFRDYLSGINIGDGFPIGLLTVSGVFLGSPFRINTTVDRSVVSRGNTFYPSGFDYTLPERLSEGTQRNSFVLPVSDKTIWSSLRSHPTELTLLFEIVLSSTPDEVEQGPFKLVDVGRALETNTQILSIECSYRNVMRNPRPGKKYTPRGFPGMFARPNYSTVGAA